MPKKRESLGLENSGIWVHLQVHRSPADRSGHACQYPLIKSQSLSLKQRLRSERAAPPSPVFVYWKQQSYFGRR